MAAVFCLILILFELGQVAFSLQFLRELFSVFAVWSCFIQEVLLHRFALVLFQNGTSDEAAAAFHPLIQRWQKIEAYI